MGATGVVLMVARRRLVRVGQLAGASLGVALFVSGCAGGAAPGTSRVSGQSVIEEIPSDQRQHLAPFSGQTLDAKTFRSTDYTGRVLVVNVWGSWCSPCRAEAPALKQVSTEMASMGVQFVGIDVKDNDAAARAFERGYGITYPSITTDASGAALLAIGQVLPSNAVPSTIVIDQSGAVAARIVGASDRTTLEDLIRAVVAERPGSPTARHPSASSSTLPPQPATTP